MPDCAARGVVDRVVVALVRRREARASLARRIRRRHVRDRADRDRPRSKRSLELAPLRPGADGCSASCRIVAARSSGSTEHGFPVGAVRAGRHRRRVSRSAGDSARAALFRQVARGRLRRSAPASLRRPRRGRIRLGGARRRPVRGRAGARPRARALGDGGAAARPANRSSIRRAVNCIASAGSSTWRMLPGDVDPRGGSRRGPRARTRAIAEQLALEGLLAVEMFLTARRPLARQRAGAAPAQLVSRLRAACATSQFEQLVRAVCDLPLGAPSRRVRRRS